MTAEGVICDFITILFRQITGFFLVKQYILRRGGVNSGLYTTHYHPLIRSGDDSWQTISGQFLSHSWHFWMLKNFRSGNQHRFESNFCCCIGQPQLHEGRWWATEMWWFQTEMHPKAHCILTDWRFNMKKEYENIKNLYWLCVEMLFLIHWVE